MTEIHQTFLKTHTCHVEIHDSCTTEKIPSETHWTNHPMSTPRPESVPLLRVPKTSEAVESVFFFQRHPGSSWVLLEKMEEQMRRCFGRAPGASSGAFCKALDIWKPLESTSCRLVYRMICSKLMLTVLTSRSRSLDWRGGKAFRLMGWSRIEDQSQAMEQSQKPKQLQKARIGFVPQQPERLGVLPIKLRGGLGQPPETLHQVPRGSEGMEPVPK